MTSSTLPRSLDVQAFKNSSAFTDERKIRDLPGWQPKSCFQRVNNETIDYVTLWQEVMKRGGYDVVDENDHWVDIYRARSGQKEVHKGAAVFQDCAVRIQEYLQASDAADIGFSPETPTQPAQLGFKVPDDPDATSLDAAIRIALQRASTELSRYLEADENIDRRAVEELREQLGALYDTLRPVGPRVTIALLGATGVGKTYLLNMLLRITEILSEQYKPDQSEAWKDAQERATEDENVLIANLDTLLTELQQAKICIGLVKPPSAFAWASGVLQEEQDSLEAFKRYITMTNRARQCEETKERTPLYMHNKTDKKDYINARIKPFILPSAVPDIDTPTTAHRLTIRFGASWQIAVKYRSLKSLREQLAQYNFSEGEANLRSPTVDEETKANHERMVALRKVVLAANPDGSLPEIKYLDKNAATHDSADVGGGIRFNEAIKRAAGKELVFVGPGKNSLEDRVYLRRVLNGLLFHGLDKCNDWPEPRSDKDQTLRSGEAPAGADTAIIEEIVLYAPSLLLQRKVQLQDVPGSNDTNADNYMTMKEALENCDGVVVVGDKDTLQSDRATADVLKKYVAPQLFDPAKTSSSIIKVRYFKLSEKGSPKDLDDVIEARPARLPTSTKLEECLLDSRLTLEAVARGMLQAELESRKAVIMKDCAAQGELLPTLYGSTICNFRQRLGAPELIRTAMEKTNMLRLLELFSDVAHQDLRTKLETVGKTISTLINSVRSKIRSLSQAVADVQRRESVSSPHDKGAARREAKKVFDAAWEANNTSEGFEALTVKDLGDIQIDAYNRHLNASFGRLENTSSSVVTIRNATKDVPKGTHPEARRSFPAQGEYFDNKATLDKLSWSKFEKKRQELVKRAHAETIAKLKHLGKDIQSKEIRLNFEQFVTESADIKSIVERTIGDQKTFSTVLRDALRAELKQLFFESFDPLQADASNGSITKQDLMKTFQSCHDAFQSKVNPTIGKGLHRFLDARYSGANRQLGKMTGPRQRTMYRAIVPFFKAAAGASGAALSSRATPNEEVNRLNKFMVYLQGLESRLESFEDEVEPTVEELESQLKTNIVLQRTLKESNRPVVLETAIQRRCFAYELSPNKTIRELHEVVSKSTGQGVSDIRELVRKVIQSTSTDVVAAVTVSASSSSSSSSTSASSTSSASTESKRQKVESPSPFDDISANWIAFLESAYSSTLAKFQEDFGITLQTFLKPFGFTSSQSYAEFKRIMENKFKECQAQVPLLRAAAISLNIVFSVNGGEYYICPVHPGPNKLPVVAIYWSQVDGWSTIPKQAN